MNPPGVRTIYTIKNKGVIGGVQLIAKRGHRTKFILVMTNWTPVDYEVCSKCEDRNE